MEINKIPILKVKIADTPESQARGLMFVKKLESDSGMLFIFGGSKNLNFWGENTYLPLDICFVNENWRIIKIDRISPLSRKTVTSGQPCKYAIEANVGFFEDNGVGVGDLVMIDKKTSSVLFFKKNSKELTASIKSAQNLDDDMVQKYPTLSDYFNYLDQQNNQPVQVEETDLPVLDSNEIGQYLEDSIEDQKNIQDEQGLPFAEPPGLDDLQPEDAQELENRIPRFSNISEAFNWAKENKEVMRINYNTSSKKRGTRILGNNSIVRDIEPHGRYTSHPDSEPSREILVTFDETVGGIRAFRMQNIKSFSFVGKKFKPKFIVR
jgi:uncharacterized membrane protein (UPF0127 family)